MDSLSLVVGLLGGAALGFLVAAYRYRGQLAAEEGRREAREAAIDREKQIFEAQLTEMKTTFQGLASESLEASNKSFLGLATERMKPLEKQLDKLQAETKEMEAKRSTAFRHSFAAIGRRAGQPTSQPASWPAGQPASWPSSWPSM